MNKNDFITAFNLSDKQKLKTEDVKDFIAESVKMAKEKGCYEIRAILDNFVRLTEKVCDNDKMGVLQELADCFLSVGYLSDYYDMPASIEFQDYPIFKEQKLPISLLRDYLQVSHLLQYKKVEKESFDFVIWLIMGGLAGVRHKFGITDMELNRAVYVVMKQRQKELKAYGYEKTVYFTDD